MPEGGEIKQDGQFNLTLSLNAKFIFFLEVYLIAKKYYIEIHRG